MLEMSVGAGVDPSLQAIKPAGAITFLQAGGYLSSHRASSPFGQYQIILLGDRCVFMVNNLQ